VLFRPRRGDTGPDRSLDHRMLLFAIGAALALVGIAFDLGWLVYIAIATLAAGAILGIIRQRRHDIDA
jgi:hypothetical protein